MFYLCRTCLDNKGDPFQYSYAVEAEPTVNETRVRQSKAESSDGQEVVGQYKVLLPDGRLQTVSYTSGPNGYKATVKYVQVGVNDNTAASQLSVSSSTESSSNGRSFTVSRTRTTPTTPTTTTSAPPPPIIVAEETVDERQQTKQRQSEPSIDSRTSPSRSRQRQQSNRTLGERFRSSAQETNVVAAPAPVGGGKMTTTTTGDMATASNAQTDDNAVAIRTDLTAASRFNKSFASSSSSTFGMKTTRRFDANHRHGSTDRQDFNWTPFFNNVIFQVTNF